MTDKAGQLNASADRPAGRCSRTRRILGGAIIVIAVAGLYLPSLEGEFSWDDDTWLWNNRVIAAGKGIDQYWLARTKLPDYLPVTSTVFHLEWRLFGRNPLGYRLVNVALHAAGAVLVWLVLRRLAIPGAWLAGLFFAIHPVCAASVAWITELKNVLSLPLAAGGLLAFLRFERNARRAWYAVALVLFAAALLGKASVVILPVVLLGCAWWQRRQITGRDLVRSIPFFLLAAAGAAATIWSQYRWSVKDATIDPPANLLESVAVAGQAVWFYLAKALAPVGLSMIYPQWDIHHPGVLSFAPLLAAIAVAVVLWRYRKGWGRPAAFALGYYVLALAPTLGFFKMSYMAHSYVADHWHYLALIGPVALVVGLASAAVARYGPRVRALGLATAVAAAGVLGYLTLCQAMLHGAPEKLWQNAARRAPGSWAANNNCGCSMFDAGRYDDALAYLRRTVQIRPDHAKAYRNMGVLLENQGRKAEAIAAFANAVKIDPRFFEPQLRLGRLYGEAGRLDEAAAHLQAALDVMPTSALAHYHLGIVYTERGEADQALRRFAAAVLYDPNFAEAHNRLGMALFDRRDFERAALEFARAIELDPNDAFKHNNLGSALLGMNRVEEAVRHYRDALAVDPNNASARRNLDLALRRLGEKP